MGELPFAVEDTHLAAEHRQTALVELLLTPGLLEERERQLARGAVGHDDLEAVSLAAAASIDVGHAVDLLDPGHHRDVLVDLQGREIGQLPTVGVAAGVVPE